MVYILQYLYHENIPFTFISLTSYVLFWFSTKPIELITFTLLKWSFESSNINSNHKHLYNESMKIVLIMHLSPNSHC